MPAPARFTEEDDDALRQWVADHGDVKVKGRKLWTDAEEAKLLPGRTWQAMRERYTKYVRLPCLRGVCLPRACS